MRHGVGFEVGVGGLAVGVDGDRPEFVHHGVFGRADLDGQFPLARVLRHRFGAEDTRLAGAVDAENLVRQPLAGEAHADLAGGDCLEVGQTADVGGEGGFLADDQAGKLDEQLGALGEMGELLATPTVAMARFGLGRRRRMAAVLGMFMAIVATSGEEDGGEKGCNQGLVHCSALRVMCCAPGSRKSFEPPPEGAKSISGRPSD